MFGCPSAFLGLMTEPVVITLAFAGLSAVRFPRRIMVAAQALYTVGLGFAFWLFHQALFDIGALCPWCTLVTFSTTLVWLALLHILIRDGNLGLPRRLQAALEAGVQVRLDLAVGVARELLLVLRSASAGSPDLPVPFRGTVTARPPRGRGRCAERLAHR